MKVFTVAVSLFALTDAVSVKRSFSASFGPENCVALTRSAAGSCVISTDCEGADLSDTEFAFDCVSKTGIVRHSFGLGGFEATEEFDTEVKCSRCESPAAADVVVAKKPVPEAPKPVAKAEPKVVEAPKVPHAAVVFKAKRRHSVFKVDHKAKAKVSAKADAKAKFWPFTGPGSLAPKMEPEAVKYGPNGCVKTWKSAQGHCMIATDCKNSDISKYEFGLVCVDKVGSPVRHLFGKDSFDKQETFDTLIKCDKCLGLEDIPDEVALNGEVVTMSKDIANLKDVMKNISINVQMLNDEVFKKAAPGPAPAAAGPAPAAAAKPKAPVKQLVQASTEHHRSEGNLRHSHKKHRQEEDYDEDEDDDYDDRDDRDDREEPASAVQQKAAVTYDDEDRDGDDELGSDEGYE